MPAAHAARGASILSSWLAAFPTGSVQRRPTHGADRWPGEGEPAEIGRRTDIAAAFTARGAKRHLQGGSFLGSAFETTGGKSEGKEEEEELPGGEQLEEASKERAGAKEKAMNVEGKDFGETASGEAIAGGMAGLQGLTGGLTNAKQDISGGQAGAGGGLLGGFGLGGMGGPAEGQGSTGGGQDTFTSGGFGLGTTEKDNVGYEGVGGPSTEGARLGTGAAGGSGGSSGAYSLGTAGGGTAGRGMASGGTAGGMAGGGMASGGMAGGGTGNFLFGGAQAAKSAQRSTAEQQQQDLASASAGLQGSPGGTPAEGGSGMAGSTTGGKGRGQAGAQQRGRALSPEDSFQPGVPGSFRPPAPDTSTDRGMESTDSFGTVYNGTIYFSGNGDIAPVPIQSHLAKQQRAIQRQRFMAEHTPMQRFVLLHNFQQQNRRYGDLPPEDKPLSTEGRDNPQEDLLKREEQPTGMSQDKPPLPGEGAPGAAPGKSASLPGCQQAPGGWFPGNGVTTHCYWGNSRMSPGEFPGPQKVPSAPKQEAALRNGAVSGRPRWEQEGPFIESGYARSHSEPSGYLPPLPHAYPASYGQA